MTMRGWLCVGGWMLLFSLGAADASGKEAAARLRDLEDGETAVYGCGDHEVTARRTGDRVTLLVPGKDGGQRVLEIDLKGGDGLVSVEDAGPEAAPSQERRVSVTKRAAGAAPAIAPVFEAADQRTVVLAGGGGGRTVACPRGDAMLRLEAGDAGSYRCPKHGLGLVAASAGDVWPSIVVSREAPSNGDVPLSFETRTIAGDEPKYTGKPLSLDF